MSLFVITLFAFLGAVSLLASVAMLSATVHDSPRARMEKRFKSIGLDPSATTTQVQSLLKSTMLSDIPWLNELLMESGFHKLHILIERANVKMTVGYFMLLSAVVATGVFTTLLIMDQPLLLAIPGGLASAIIPQGYLRYLAKKRVRRFLEQFPDALDVIARGLHAGLGINQAVVLIGREMPDPVGTEFAIFVEEVNLGLPLADALRNLETKIPLTEVRLWSAALVVQREAGGSLAELLDKLGAVIRDRFRIEGTIKTLTAQNRMSAVVVSAVPVVIAMITYYMDPEGTAEVLANPLGQMMLGVAVGLEILGILVFRKLLQIRI